MKRGEQENNRRILAEALRSGRFTRTTGYLAFLREGKSVGYCCMGVAGVLVAASFPEEFSFSSPLACSDWGKFYKKGNEFPFTGTLPEEASSLLFPEGDQVELQDIFIDLNDSGTSWDVIADLLELPDDRLIEFMEWHRNNYDRESASAFLSHVRGDSAKVGATPE